MPRRDSDLMRLRKERMLERYNELYKSYSFGSVTSKHDMALDQLSNEFYLKTDTINRLLFKQDEEISTDQQQV